MPEERRADSKRLRPTCWDCGRQWPDPASGLCGGCRAERGLPGIRDYRSPSDAMPDPKPKPVYRVLEQ